MKVESVPPAAGRVFISYRREETAYAAGWLFDRLVDRFGRGQIFKDIDSIQLGDDFVEVITAAVGSCDVLLALIGDRWLTITDERGRARLDDPDDFVRLEIEAALTRNVRVIPILVEGARMPRADHLPPSLGKLARRHALELSPSRFESDTSRLHQVLDQALADVHAQQAVTDPVGTPESGPPRLPPIAVTAPPEPHSPPLRAPWIAIVLATVLLISGGIAWGVGAAEKPAANRSTAEPSTTPSSHATTPTWSRSSRPPSTGYRLSGDAFAYTGPSARAYGSGQRIPGSTRVNVICDAYGEVVGTNQLWHFTDHGWLNDHDVRTGTSDPVRNSCTGNVNRPREGSQRPSLLVGPFGTVGFKPIPVRDAPENSGAQVDAVKTDQLITLMCHVQGDYVVAPPGGSSSADWDMIGPGRWIPDADLLTGHYSGSPAPACPNQSTSPRPTPSKSQSTSSTSSSSGSPTSGGST
jgi:TIR domain